MNSLFDSISKSFGQTEIPARLQPPLLLAYIGDVVFEMVVRSWVCAGKDTKVVDLHKKTVKFVKAKAQSEMMNVIEPLLTEEELAIYKRGRNTKSSVPKSAEVSEYRRATGLEAVIGYLYLNKESDRVVFLVNTGIQHMVMMLENNLKK